MVRPFGFSFLILLTSATLSQAKDITLCVREFSQIAARPAASIKVVAARHKIWEIFESDVTETLQALSPEVRRDVLFAMGKTEWKDDLPSLGQARYHAPTHGFVAFEVRGGSKGKVVSLLTLRHELEHVVDFAERSRNVSLSRWTDRLHLRRPTSRYERRAFTAQYQLMRKIEAAVPPETLRRILVEESGLPRELWSSLELVLERGTLASQKWTDGIALAP